MEVKVEAEVKAEAGKAENKNSVTKYLLLTGLGERVWRGKRAGRVIG